LIREIPNSSENQALINMLTAAEYSDTSIYDHLGSRKFSSSTMFPTNTHFATLSLPPFSMKQSNAPQKRKISRNSSQEDQLYQLEDRDQETPATLRYQVPDMSLSSSYQEPGAHMSLFNKQPTSIVVSDDDDLSSSVDSSNLKEATENCGSLDESDKKTTNNSKMVISAIRKHQPTEQQQMYQHEDSHTTTTREASGEENSLDDTSDHHIIIRSYDYKTDEKQVNKIFVEGIKSIIPNYLQTFYLFVRTFGWLKVLSFLSLLYTLSFLFHMFTLQLICQRYPLEDFSKMSMIGTVCSYFFTDYSLSLSASIVLTLLSCTGLVFLVLCGLSKYVDYSARSYIYQQFKFSDMANIMKYYIWDEDNHFWVATLKSTGEVVGTIGVRKRRDQEGVVELKRMSVSSTMKRRGIATLMLNHLVEWSKNKGYQTIMLSTSSLQVAAVDFYQKHGFEIVKTKRFSRFLPTAYLTFEKHITNQ